MKKSKNKKSSKSAKVTAKAMNNDNTAWLSRNKWYLLITILPFLLYVNTLGHDFAQDDAIVIYDNMFTQKGISGIPGILTNDTFYGFFKEEGKAKLVSGGRYRPMSQIMFAVEWEIFGKSPFAGHLINVILYSLLCLISFKYLLLLFKIKRIDSEYGWLILAACLIFAAHPIHTEVVANIKGRDEILAMLGSVGALFYLLKWTDSGKAKYKYLSLLSFFIGLMSKENAITMLGVAPVSLMLFRNYTFLKSIKSVLGLFGVALLFIAIRTSVLGWDMGDHSRELMNNPFLKFEGGRWVELALGEKYATVFYTLGKYLQLLIFPHPLSHDYYPRAIEIMSFTDWRVIISIILYGGLIWSSFRYFKKHKPYSFGVIFYLLTLSIVSNIVFPIGTNMSERFVFMPSLGFTLAATYLQSHIINNRNLRLGVLSIILIAFAFKTVTRNQFWKDDFTLFTSDVSDETKSAKLLNAAGGALSTKASSMPESAEKTKMLIQADQYLKRAIQIHPTYRNAYLLLGNTQYYLKNYDQAIQYYDQALKISPNFGDVLRNLPIVLRDGAKYKGQVEKDYPTAERWLLRAYQINPNDFETSRLLGVTYGVMGNHQKAVEFFEKARQINPESAIINAALGTALRNVGDTENARKYLERAIEIDPNALSHLKSK